MKVLDYSERVPVFAQTVTLVRSDGGTNYPSWCGGRHDNPKEPAYAFSDG
jgi:hypothetical protein